MLHLMPVLTPNRISIEIQNLQELCPAQFVEVLFRRKKEDAVKIRPDTNRNQPGPAQVDATSKAQNSKRTTSK